MISGESPIIHLRWTSIHHRRRHRSTTAAVIIIIIIWSYSKKASNPLKKPKFTPKPPSRQKLVLPKSDSDDCNEEDAKIAWELLRKANDQMMMMMTAAVVDRCPSEVDDRRFIWTMTVDLELGFQLKIIKKERGGVRKGMVTGSGSLRSMWLTKDMVHSIKYGNQVLNSKPLVEFNPSIGHVVKCEVDKPKDARLPIWKINLLMHLQKMQTNPIFHILVDILQNTNLFRAFTTSANVPSIYIQLFWNTLGKDTKSGVFSFQLDKLWFDLNVDLLRNALGITPKDSAHPFVSPPSGDLVLDFVNNLRLPRITLLCL
nr:hypothetical protein [Tanacetum cinerariifolium]